MNPNQPIQQPVQPPESPSPYGDGQYDFLNTPPPEKKKFFSGGNGGVNSKLKLVAIVLGIFMLVFLIFSLLFRGGGDGDVLFSLAQKQNEVIRIAKIGKEKAGENKAQSIAINTSMTVTTQQRDIFNLIAINGKKFKAKELVVGADLKVDEELATAATNGRFDEVFINTIKTQLEQYQAKLKSTFTEVQGKNAKLVISSSNDDVTLLLESIKR